VDCEQAELLLVADMDREILTADRLLLDTHLRDCEACRHLAEALRVQDADLRQAFGQRRQAVAALTQRVLAELRLTPRPAQRRPWVHWVLAAAAGFLLAVLVFRPWQKQPPEQAVAPPPEVILVPSEPASPAENFLLTVANEAVEVWPPGSTQWQPAQPGSLTPVGARVRTGPAVRCEFRCPDGSEIRLNNDTELQFQKERQVDLARGQIMARVTKAAMPFQVKIPQATVTALGTEFDLQCKPPESTLLVLEGATEVKGKSQQRRINSGETTTITANAIGEPERVTDIIQKTNWIHEILIRKGSNNDEVARRINAMLEEVGHAKVSFLPEARIRTLGDACVLPLTRFIQSPRSRRDQEKREAVAAIIADLAQPWSIPDLIDLLGDSDGTVRQQAARGLQRLTRETFDREPAQWQSDSLAACQRTQRRWQDWWQSNQHLYPVPPIPAKVTEQPLSK
jgi:ferric-dicitrate binding protein FerR (iron transport regulator)